MKSPNFDEKVHEYNWKVFFGLKKMNECRNTMLYQILSNHHLGAFSKSEKKLDLSPLFATT